MIWSAKWWTLMMNSVMPKVRRRVRVISRRVRPESSTRALGRVSVSGLRRGARAGDRGISFFGGGFFKGFSLFGVFWVGEGGGFFHPHFAAPAVWPGGGRGKRGGA